MMTVPKSTRGKSGHPGHGDNRTTSAVPDSCPGSIEVGTGIRDTLTLWKLGLSRLSRVVPGVLRMGCA